MPSLSEFYLNTLGPVLFVLLLGLYAGKRRRMQANDASSLNVLLMHFALPCSLFLGVARVSLATVRSQLPLVLVLSLAMLLVFAVTFLGQWRLGRSTGREAAVQALTVSFPNNVAVGLPLLGTLFGPLGLLAVAAAIVSGALVVSPLTLVLLEYHTSGVPERSPATRLLPAVAASLRRPVVLAPLVALLVPLSGFTLPQAAVLSADLLGKATVGLALFLTGLMLASSTPRLTRAVLAGVLLKNACEPALAAVVLAVLHLHGTLAQETLLLAAVPAGFFGTVFAARYGVSSQTTSATLLWSTVLSAATLPVVIHLSGYLR